jgi:hypothetical protein
MNDILFILQDLKVCGNGMLIMLLNFWHYLSYCFFFLFLNNVSETGLRLHP